MIGGMQPRAVDFVARPIPGSAFLGADFPSLTVDEDISYTVTNGAVGFKASMGAKLLLSFNLLFKIDSKGLRDTVTPLVGFEYSF